MPPIEELKNKLLDSKASIKISIVHVQNGRFSVEEPKGFNLDVV